MRAIVVAALMVASAVADPTYPIVDTGQVRCYDIQSEIAFPDCAEIATEQPAYYGQDAQYLANAPSYTNHDDGTVSDLVTGLMWQADPGEKKTYDEAVSGAKACRTGGYSDWRLPTVKELYSLIQFSGTDPDPRSGVDAVPFIDTDFFKFQYGKEEDGDRLIDSQWATSTIYKGTVMRGMAAMFGVNFADGRIKGYPVETTPHRGKKKFYVLYVRGNEQYGLNNFVDNGDGTITDKATGLIWMKADSGRGMDWPSALEYAETLELAGHDDWRLPSAKELQSIVDYSRSPDSTDSAAIDPVFEVTEITNEKGQPDYGWYWTSTSHVRGTGSEAAIYVTFGRSLGWMADRRSPSGDMVLLDVHGAGSQRSDPKVGDAAQFPQGRGPQGDVIRIQNLVRCVRGGGVTKVTSGPKIKTQQSSSRQARIRDREQSPHRPTGPSGRDFIEREDRNGDGKVARNEFRGPAEHFDRFDRNADGFITEQEAPTGPPPRGQYI